jgi:hypothetical protein
LDHLSAHHLDWITFRLTIWNGSSFGSPSGLDHLSAHHLAWITFWLTIWLGSPFCSPSGLDHLSAHTLAWIDSPGGPDSNQHRHSNFRYQGPILHLPPQGPNPSSSTPSDNLLTSPTKPGGGGTVGVRGGDSNYVAIILLLIRPQGCPGKRI